MKKFISILLSLVFIFCMAAPAFAESPNGPYEFTMSDGSVVEYYLDENQNPYNIINGEKVLLPIPLPHLLLKDEKWLAEIWKTLPDDPRTQDFQDEISLLSEPTNYVDLTGGGTNKSNTYSASAYFAGDEILTTPIFKLRRNDSGLIYQYADISAPFGSRSRINLVYTRYDVYRDTWDSLMFSQVSGRCKIMHTPYIYPYCQFSFNQYDDIYSFTYEVYSTPQAS